MPQGRSDITTTERVVFAAGDLFGGGGAAIISVLYLFFLTDIIGLNPALAGSALLVAKMWDAINDPLMGAISDRTRTRIGRRRPYILIGGLLLIGALAVLWLPNKPGGTQLQMAAWASISCIVYNSVSTVIAVPYASLSTEVTTDLDERNKVNVMRLLFSTVSSAGSTLLASRLFELYDNGTLTAAELYGWIVLGFGGFFTVVVLGVALFTRERVPLPAVHDRLTPRLFVAPLRFRPFRRLVGMYICQALTMDVISAVLIYYSKYVVNVSPTMFLGVFIVIDLVAFVVVNRLVKTVSKHTIYRTGIPLALVAVTVIALYPRGGPVWLVYALAGLLAIGMAGAQLMSWVIFPDVLDASELESGQRNAGSYGGLMTFSRGLATAMMTQVVGLVLAITGYLATAEDVVVVQPDSAIWGIRLVLLISVVVLMTLAWFVARGFPLDRATTVAMQDRLAARRTTAARSNRDPDAPSSAEHL
ncbi:MAG: MFS transporter [Propionibacteriales bacterium]|nr:MFS transporter [Propionibacteriales bacterium]